MPMRKFLIIAALLAAATPALAIECKLKVEGKTYISGPCKFSRIDKGGSFQIMGGDKWFAQVFPKGDGTADAFLER
jgi:hypothetical protein